MELEFRGIQLSRSSREEKPPQDHSKETSKEIITHRGSRWLQILYRVRGSQALEGAWRLRVSLISERVNGLETFIQKVFLLKLRWERETSSRTN
jgi:hypothetical protein